MNKYIKKINIITILVFIKFLLFTVNSISIDIITLKTKAVLDQSHSSINGIIYFINKTACSIYIIGKIKNLPTKKT